MPASTLSRSQIVGEHALELHGIVNGGRWWHPVNH
jgi:hypothetical protein